MRIRISNTIEEASVLVHQIADELYDIVTRGEAYESVADEYSRKYDEKVAALPAAFFSRELTSQCEVAK